MINWVGFIPAALLISLIPGANQLLGLSNAVRHGTAYALAGIGGRLAAFVVLIGLVVAGLGAILATSATALTVIKWVGVVYLAWIGFSSLRRARRAPAAISTVSPSDTGQRLRPLIVNEFVVGISNPKALLLFAVSASYAASPGSRTEPVTSATSVAASSERNRGTFTEGHSRGHSAGGQGRRLTRRADGGWPVRGRPSAVGRRQVDRKWPGRWTGSGATMPGRFTAFDFLENT
ncbi:LysE family translocator [Nonomuraea sp. bgisy101]|uniref:LysE family translocator n=1 Tax=Nonomuraea sp. bgisy101 TaxID=3413784 RepID=UPI003D75EE88